MCIKISKLRKNLFRNEAGKNLNLVLRNTPMSVAVSTGINILLIQPH